MNSKRAKKLRKLVEHKFEGYGYVCHKSEPFRLNDGRQAIRFKFMVVKKAQMYAFAKDIYSKYKVMPDADVPI